jgi:hypothetical protein
LLAVSVNAIESVHVRREVWLCVEVHGGWIQGIDVLDLKRPDASRELRAHVFWRPRAIAARKRKREKEREREREIVRECERERESPRS